MTLLLLPGSKALISCVLSEQWCCGPRALPTRASCLPHTRLSAAREGEISKHEVKRINVTRKEMGSELSTLPRTDCRLGAWMQTINSSSLTRRQHLQSALPSEGGEGKGQSPETLSPFCTYPKGHQGMQPPHTWQQTEPW